MVALFQSKSILKSARLAFKIGYMMTASEYKAALAALKWDHITAAQALGIGRRTSQRYAVQGAPRLIAVALQALINQKPKRKRAA